MGKAFFILFAIVACSNELSAAPTCETLKTNWKTYYYDAFGLMWGNKDKLDCPGGESLVAEAFYHLHAPTFGASAPKFYEYAAGLIRNTRYDESCKDGANARRETGLLTICPAFFNGDVEWRTGTIVHEARHMEWDDPTHVDCNKGRYIGDKVACDARFYGGNGQGSGFNADFRFFAFLRQSTTRHELSDWTLQSRINALIPDRFNEINENEVKRWRKD